MWWDVLTATGIQWQNSLSVLICYVQRLLSLLIAQPPAVCHFCYVRQCLLATTTFFFPKQNALSLSLCSCATCILLLV